jgi:serine/threonine-protein kinase
MRAPAAIEKAHAMLTQENILARYKVLHELGRGATGAVYAARDRETGAVVALKRLDPALLSKSDANFADRFLKHARSARHLRHRNIVTIHDAGEAGGTVYVAMEMLEGESLRKILDDGPLRIARAIRIARDIACGLAYAHLEAAVHGGIKPSNIIVLRSGAVKITDFGTGQHGQAALLSGARAGVSYMAPEQLRGEPVDHRSDIFSLGALFYEMLTHRPPFEGDSPKEILESIVHAEPPPPSELNPHVPRALDAIVLSMLAGQPAARMPGVPILLRDLQRLEEGLGLGSEASAGTDEPAASVPPPGPEPGRRTPDPNRFRDREPMQDAPRFARHGEFRDASGFGVRPDSSAAEELQHGDRTTDREAFDYHKAMAMMERESGQQRSSRSRPGTFAKLALVLAVLGIGLTGFMYYSSGQSERGIAAGNMQEAPATAPGASRPTAPPPVAEATKKDSSMVDRASEQPESAGAAPAQQLPQARQPAAPGRLTAPAPVAEATKEPVTAPGAAQAPPPRAVGDGQAQQKPSVVDRAPQQPETTGVAPTQQLPQARQPAAKVAEQRPGGTAQLILAVSPRGEIYIDGKHHGTTPPITTFNLEPGMYRIEVRNGSRKPFLTYMTVQAGDVRRIRHDFNAKPIRPPT